MANELFRAKAPAVMRRLMAEPLFDLALDDAAAILGNIGHECGGFQLMQEVRPVVKGSRGGFGWCQWTASRRRTFEAWCERKKLAPTSDEANYSYLYRELAGEEGEPALRAINATKAAGGLEAKVIAFEKAFLRAGKKHYDNRTLWARRAKEAYLASTVPDVPPVEPPVEKERGWLAALLKIFATLFGALFGRR